MLIIKILLFPFSILYDLVTRVRNHAYNIGSRHSVSFDIPVINVGNLTVGGTGKTPHVEYLVKQLKDKRKISILSRGYKRSTKGFLMANENSNAISIGDEPMQFWSKFGPEVKVAVGEDRALAIPQILQNNADVDTIILDDAFQHRAVKPGFNILLTDFNRLFYKDFLLPSGRLRECRSNANRADVVIVSKCPNDLDEKTKVEVRNKVNKYLKNGQQVLFTTIEYGELKPIFNYGLSGDKKIVGVAGIAKADLFKNKLSSDYDLQDFIQFPDHHKYSKSDVDKISALAKSNTVICTEKDMVKLKEFDKELSMLPIFYLPMEISFLGDSEIFDDLIHTYLAKYN